MTEGFTWMSCGCYRCPEHQSATCAEAGKKGGAISGPMSTPAKAAAARENGKKGGRRRKEQNESI